MYTNHGRVCRTGVARGVTAMRSGLLHGMALVILALGLVSCAEFTDLRADITSLQSDLNSNSETLAKISARVAELERRQSISDRVSGQAPRELTEAIEVLLKKALVTQSRLTALESAELPSKGAEKPVKQTRQPVPSSDDTASPEATPLSLGMTREEVRRVLGDPISTETAGSYIVWQYSKVNHQKYVIFEKVTGQVSGWWGL